METRALARLIGFAAVDINARELGLTVSENIVANVIRADPAFAGPTGQFSKNQFNQLIRQYGYQSEGQYIQARHRDILREQLTETLGAGVTPQAAFVDVLHRYREETRVIEYFTPDYDKHIKIADPDDSKLQEFYEQNKRQYIALEHRKANLLLLTRDATLSRITVTDEEIKAAYDAAKDSYNIPEKRRIAQLTFPDKAAADKAYAELSKAKNFEETAAKLGFPAADIDLGLLTRPEMIDPKIAEAAFALKKDELSRPVEGQFSVALLRVTDIQGGKQRTFDEVKAEIKDRIANERVGQKLQELHDAAETDRAKGKPLKEIGDQLKLPFREIAEITRLGKTGDGKTVIEHADAGRIAEAIFEASPGVETEALELADGGYAWFDVVATTPERQKTLDEVKAEVKANYYRRREAQGDGSLCRQADRAHQSRRSNGEACQGAGRQPDAHRPLPALGNAARLADGCRAAGLRLGEGRGDVRAHAGRKDAPHSARGRRHCRPRGDPGADCGAQGRARQAGAHRPAGAVCGRPAHALRLQDQRGAAEAGAGAANRAAPGYQRRLTGRPPLLRQEAHA